VNVLHFVGGDIKHGAAKGAYTLHRGLTEVGVSSKVLTNSFPIPDDDLVISLSSSKKGRLFSLLRSQADSLFSIFYRSRQKRIFSTGLIGSNFIDSKICGWPDIIHLHWINAGFVNIKHLRHIRKPIVWTMRDMWPFTGGCHYSMDCARYKAGCGFCPQLGSKSKIDLSRWVVARKKRYLPKGMKVVGISEWLSHCARESEVFRGFDVRTIPNAIDTHLFFPIEKETARRVLDLPQHVKIMLIGARNVTDFYKGFPEFLRAIEVLPFRENFMVVAFGNFPPGTVYRKDFPFKRLGFLNDEISLRIAYSAADVFLAPSTMESFGKTLAESMACGTPVVAFASTGPKEIVDHEKNGYLAVPFSGKDLARGIDWVLGHPDPQMLARNARQKVLDHFEMTVVAKQYKALYEEMLAEQAFKSQ
jgi:glycosyltransferase involved in cell wall biosynthesis